jgi:hypothetical protein
MGATTQREDTYALQLAALLPRQGLASMLLHLPAGVLVTSKWSAGACILTCSPL